MTNDPPSGPAATPRKIHADRPTRRLVLDWGDGHKSVYDFTVLRWLCPCAFCRGEGGQPGWLDSNPTLTEEQVTLTDMSLVGHYAIQPFWEDGHGSGFYAFERLREHCPCGECEARRAREAAATDGLPPHTHD